MICNCGIMQIWKYTIKYEFPSCRFFFALFQFCFQSQLKRIRDGESLTIQACGYVVNQLSPTHPRWAPMARSFIPAHLIRRLNDLGRPTCCDFRNKVPFFIKTRTTKNIYLVRTFYLSSRLFENTKGKRC